MRDPAHAQLLGLLTRRQALRQASLLSAGALATPLLPAGSSAHPSSPPAAPSLPDASLQAFADTMIPGRPATITDLGNAIAPMAISGVDRRPGAVEADALALYHHPEVGFDALEPAFLADLSARSLAHGGAFLDLSFASRVQVCLAGLDFNNPSVLVWEAAAAIPFTAFCAAALIRNANAAKASGYRVMGLPGIAPGGYTDYSYRRRLSPERTRSGSLP